MQRFTVTVLVCLLMLAGTEEIFAGGERAYGLRYDGTYPDMIFFRMDISTGKVVHTVRDLPGPVVDGSSALDEKNNRFFYATEKELVVLQTPDGALLQKIDLSVPITGLEYDRVNDILYCLAGHQSGVQFGSFDLAAGEFRSIAPLQEIGSLGHPHNYGYGYTFDYHRNLYVCNILQGSTFRLIAIDAADGAIVKSFSGLRMPRGFHYDHVSKNILAIAEDRNSGTPLALYTVNLDAEPGREISKVRIELNGFLQHHVPSALDQIGRCYLVPVKSGETDYIDLTSGKSKKFQGTTGSLLAIEIGNYLDEWATITGRLFNDENGDCTADAGEIGLPRRMVHMAPGDFYTQSDRNGNYTISVPPGTYRLNVPSFEYWRESCSTGVFDIELKQGDAPVEKDFGFAAEGRVQKLCVSVVSGGARNGAAVEYVIDYENCGNRPFTGTLVFEYDPLLHNFRSEPAADRSLTARAEWNIVAMPIGAWGRVTVSLNVPATADVIGTEICGRAYTDLAGGGDDIAVDDADEHCDEIVGSFDPNDIRVFPSGIQPGGKISPTDSVLTYIVRFQNTGTASALEVRVSNVLSDLLDMSTLKLGASSHDFRFSVGANREMEWLFEDIDLPHAAADEAGSNGFFKYSVRLKPDLPIGTVISNQASIYFDVNEPIHTNTVLSTIDDNTSVKQDSFNGRVNVYVDRGELQVSSAIALDGKLEVYTLNGVRLLQSPLEQVYSQSIAFPAAAGGLYLVRIVTGEGHYTRLLPVLR